MAQRLCASERARIETMVEMGVGTTGMARRLGRSRSAVWRELRRNGGGSAYRADAAQAAADVRAPRPRPSKLATDPVLADAMARLLADRWKLLVRRRRKPRRRCEQAKRSVLGDFRPIAQRL
ncbi:helix-turn-helix domain-containing protein [Candidatus Poriferisocius sp.]|uniref:helix-turn-helix domain-containing protein n=1 Tax=Candidatus Poriferisocius sp. TaxID=3101276 RepID=UPI003B01B068